MFRKFTLANGLRLILCPLPSTRAVTLLVLVATGSKYELKEQNGISHLLEHMAFKGTRKRPRTVDIAKELDLAGGVYNAFTGKEFMGFWVKVERSNFELACDVLSDMLKNSLFAAGEIEKEKKVIFEEINMMQDTPQNYVTVLWEELLYGDQPAGRPIAGSKKTVASLRRQDILDYLKFQFGAGNIVIGAAGSFKEDEIKRLLKKFFGFFTATQPIIKDRTKEIQTFPKLLFHSKATDQTHLCLGVRGFNIFSPKRYVLNVLSTLLGGLMSSRLFLEVREKRSLAYYVHTYPQYYTDSGYIVTQAGVDNKRVQEAIRVILNEYSKIKRSKVPADELKKAKENIRARIYLGLETSDDWATYLAGQEIVENKINPPEYEAKMIDKVTADDIMKVAREIFLPEKLNLALIGPSGQEGKLKKVLKI